MSKLKMIVGFLILLFMIDPLSVSFSAGEVEYLTIKCGSADLTVEVAADFRTRGKGLMHREELAEGKGMIFVYPHKDICRLWMKNTYIPLSVAFLDEDGRILQIIDMKKTDSSKIYRSKMKVKYALEVPLGWFDKNDIKTGDSCIIPDIRAK